MAEAVHELPRSMNRIRVPRPSPALAYAIRFGIATTAAIWLGKAPGLVDSHSTWILITVLMLVQPTTGASLLKALLRGAGTLAAAFTAIALFGFFAQDPPLLMTGLFLVQAVCAYGFSGARFQYAWFVFAFTTAIVLGDAMAGQGAVETVAFERASMVGIGILLVFVIDSLVWPARAEPQLRAALAGRARLLSDAARRAFPASTDSGDAVAAAPAPESASLSSQLGLVSAARSELGVSRARLAALTRVAMLLETLASRQRALAAPLEIPDDLTAQAGASTAAQNELARRVEAALDEIAAALEAPRSPSPFSEELEDALLVLEEARDRLAGIVAEGRDAAEGVELEDIPLARRLGWRAGLAGRAADLRDLVTLLGALEATLSSPGESGSGQPSDSAPSLGPDPLRMQIALRSGVAVIAAFLVPMALGWPMNTTVAPIAFMTAAQTRGAAVQTLTGLSAVLALAWIVADLLIVYINPHLGRAPLAMVPAFVVAAVFAYIAAKRPQLAPLPSIGGLVVFLSVYGGVSMPTDVYGPYSTVCYMAVALGVGSLLGRLMWPATAAGLFRQRIAAQLELCLEAVRGARESDRQIRVSRLIHGSAAQSAQLGTLHRQALREPVEHALDPSRRARILSLASDLVDAVVGHQPGALDSLLDRRGDGFRPVQDAIRRVDAALVESMDAVRTKLRGEADDGASRLAESRQVFAERLEELKADPGSGSRFSADEKRRFLLLLESRRRLVSRQREIEDWLDEWRAAEAGRP